MCLKCGRALKCAQRQAFPELAQVQSLGVPASDSRTTLLFSLVLSRSVLAYDAVGIAASASLYTFRSAAYFLATLGLPIRAAFPRLP